MASPKPEASGSQPPKSQKQMTKAERRELQEKQRAAKAANKTAQTSQTQSAKSTSGSSSNAQASKKSGKAADAGGSKPTPAGGAGSKPTKDMKDVSGLAAEDMSTKNRGLRIFSHFGLPKPVSHKGEIHPAIVRLGLQFSEFKITGANARCIATLTAFKNVIQDYVTPSHNTLSRHLMTHLSPQISYLVAARPMSVTMGNAIRQLKLQISGTDIDLPEQDAKDELCHWIDNYIRDKIIYADQVIQERAGTKIKDGDVILTYARSSLVEKVLLSAFKEDDKQFSVVIADSRPLLEGKKLLQVLSSVGIPCTYLLLPSLGSVITEISTVFIGAHSLHSNGAVFSRAGTALVAMMAKQHSVPVVVCCETYKFSEAIQLDSFTRNELAPVELFSSLPHNAPKDSISLDDQPYLQIMNPLYDLTPPTSITAVVTEVGVIPPSSINSIPLALGRTMF